MFRPQDLLNILIEEIVNNKSERKLADFSFKRSLTNNKNNIERLSNAIANNTHLTSLKLLECDLEEDHIPVLAEGILKNSSLTHIELQTFDDYAEKTKNLIKSIENHVRSNRNNLTSKQPTTPPKATPSAG